MLDQIKRREELSRVNQKFGASPIPSNDTPSKVLKQQSIDEEQLLQMKTQDFFDEAERQILNNASHSKDNPLLTPDISMGVDESTKIDESNDVSRQRELDDDEFEDELNGGSGAMVQMQWKISDGLPNDRSGKSDKSDVKNDSRSAAEQDRLLQVKGNPSYFSHKDYDDEEEEKKSPDQSQKLQKGESTQLDGSDDEAYEDSDDQDADDIIDQELRDDFSLSDEGGDHDDFDDVEAEFFDDDEDDEKREREFFGDDDYNLLSKVPEEDEEEENKMSMTMQQREIKQKKDRISSLKRDIQSLQIKITQYKEEGEYEVGQTDIFQNLLDKYELLQKQEEIDDDALTEMYDEFINPIESDVSKAQILQTCQSIYNLLISLHYRNFDLKQAQSELMEIQ